jgi:protein-S-isoprenylcysteine O-methyltransferase Ste14
MHAQSLRDGRRIEMLLLKLAVVTLATVCAIAVFTYVWVTARTPGPWFSSQGQGATGIDINLVYSITVRSPIYWLLAIGILAAAVWIFRRWAFPA